LATKSRADRLERNRLRERPRDDDERYVGGQIANDRQHPERTELRNRRVRDDELPLPSRQGVPYALGRIDALRIQHETVPLEGARHETRVGLRVLDHEDRKPLLCPMTHWPVT
jgi:hypothetical protein